MGTERAMADEQARRFVSGEKMLPRAGEMIPVEGDPRHYNLDGTPKPAMRQFEGGATRNVDDSKFDYEGFLSPLVLERYAAYMHKHRVQADGTLRASDNWQKGIPQEAYIKSAWRHFMDWWRYHRGLPSNETLQTALCALMFNVMGYLHEQLKKEPNDG